MATAVSTTPQPASQAALPTMAALKSSLQDLSASDDAVLGTLNNVLTNEKSSPEMRQMAVRFFQERQEKESLLSQVVRAMGDTAMRIISNIR